MTDEWTFRTTEGRATVADGRLRIAGSLRRTLLERWRAGWTRNGAARRLLFVVSLLSTVGFASRVVPSAREALSGSADALSWFVLGAVALAVAALAYRATRRRTVRLRSIEAVRRVDPDRLRVAREGDRDDVEIETPTEADADEAVEILRLRGVPVEDGAESGEGGSAGFRERLRAKKE